MRAEAGETSFKWRRFLGAAAVLFLTVEFAGISVALVVFTLISIATSGGIYFVTDLDMLPEFALVAFLITALPAGLYSLIVAGVFTRCRWTRKALWAIGFSVAVSLGGSLMMGWCISWTKWSDAFDQELSLVLLEICLLTSAIAALILHRYFKIVEGRDG